MACCFRFRSRASSLLIHLSLQRRVPIQADPFAFVCVVRHSRSLARLLAYLYPTPPLPRPERDPLSFFLFFCFRWPSHLRRRAGWCLANASCKEFLERLERPAKSSVVEESSRDNHCGTLCVVFWEGNFLELGKKGKRVFCSWGSSCEFAPGARSCICLRSLCTAS